MCSSKRLADSPPPGEPSAKRQKVSDGNILRSITPEIPSSSHVDQPLGEESSHIVPGDPSIDGEPIEPVEEDASQAVDTDLDGIPIEPVDLEEEPLEVLTLGSSRRAASLYPP
ncbi:hypothetical protein FRB96_008857 [Tulasnella sp. 330]|nr:hypothetical protein FRB96_008857 [Tulasnella sp. 330]KAG8874815.1 hypothetical protein FRB98_008231 [Tulasnella sp. 332]KAG8880579.1 hypothetical protein FRB97_000674 [Tulasnella sp. 331]